MNYLNWISKSNLVKLKWLAKTLRRKAYYYSLRLCDFARNKKDNRFQLSFIIKYQKAYANFLSRFSLMASRKPSVVR